MASPPVILGAPHDAWSACMPHFLLTFGDASRQPVGAVIVEAPSMFQARMTAVVRRLAPGVAVWRRSQASVETVAAIPPEQIGRMISGVEAEALILRQAMQAKVLTKDENVWSGRASQEGFVELSVVRSCINVSGLSLERVLRATMDISAHAFSLAARPQVGQVGHQFSRAPGRPFLHLFSSSRRPRRETEYVIS
jgi:hypothetical protein